MCFCKLKVCFCTLKVYLCTLKIKFRTLKIYFCTLQVYFCSLHENLYFATMFGQKKVVINVHFTNANILAVRDTTYASEFLTLLFNFFLLLLLLLLLISFFLHRFSDFLLVISFSILGSQLFFLPSAATAFRMLLFQLPQPNNSCGILFKLEGWRLEGVSNISKDNHRSFMRPCKSQSNLPVMD